MLDIKHIQLDREAKKEHAKIMVKANVPFAEFHSKVKSKLHKKRESNSNDINFSRLELRKIFFKHSKRGEPFVYQGVRLSSENVEAMYELQSYQMNIISGYVKLLKKYAKKWHNSTSWLVKWDFSDVESEVFAACLEAIFGYSKDNIQFSTYLVNTISNNLSREANKNRQLTHLTNEHQKLINFYEEVLNSYNDYVTFDEVVEEMCCQDESLDFHKTYKALQGILSLVSCQSDLFVGDADEEDGDFFSNLAIAPKEPENVNQDAIDILTLADLTDWELKVLRAYVNAGHKTGWKTEVATNTINPDTGKNYSKMAPSLAMERIKKKLSEARKKLNYAA